MDGKRWLKDRMADLAYLWHRVPGRKPTVRVYSMDETLDELLQGGKSLVRFGDGEIVMMKGKSLKLQQASPELAEGLKRILGYEQENLLVTVQGIFDGVGMYHRKSRQFWKDHLLFCRKIYKRYCNGGKVYGDTAVTRCWYAFADKSRCGQWFGKFREVWRDRQVVVVEGTRSHNGVGNDLFDTAAGVERIICPPKDAYASYQEILEAFRKFPKDRLFLLSLGVTAKFLARDLHRDGYRVIDIGNLDMEYEWFLQGSYDKIPIKKHEITGEEGNRKAGYLEYLGQIKAMVGEIGW